MLHDTARRRLTGFVPHELFQSHCPFRASLGVYALSMHKQTYVCETGKVP